MSTTGYSVRALTLEDITPERMRQINELDLVLSEAGGNITADHMVRILNSGFATVFGAFENGSGYLIGMATASESAQPHGGKWWLEDVAVLPSFGGEGIGTILTAKAVLHAKEIGVKKMDLTSTNSLRDRAQRLYRRLGWQERDSWLARNDPQQFIPADFLTPEELNIIGA